MPIAGANRGPLAKRSRTKSLLREGLGPPNIFASGKLGVMARSNGPRNLCLRNIGTVGYASLCTTCEFKEVQKVRECFSEYSMLLQIHFLVCVLMVGIILMFGANCSL